LSTIPPVSTKLRTTSP